MFLVPARPAPPSRPPARRLLEPVRIQTGQPPLPLPETVPQRRVDPAIRQLARNVAAAVVEALAGRRSIHQLGTWLSTPARDRLDRLEIMPQLRLRSVRVQQPHDNAVEIAVVLDLDGQCRAAALRLDRRDARWLVTSVETSLRPRRSQHAA